MKFCGKCGQFGRTDNMRKQHFRFCQPELKGGESGFLKDGMLPETCVDDFKTTLCILGGSVKKLKTNLKYQEEQDPDETISEILSELSRRSS